MNFSAIPTEKLPDFFKDKNRRNVLYAPLRSKSTNPNDWNNKVTSWSKLINLYCNSNKTYQFSIHSLKEAFRCNGITPSCLQEVIQEMCKRGEIREYNNFMSDKPKTWKEWAIIKVSSPLSWSYQKILNLVNTHEETYVPMTVLTEEGDLLMINSKLKNKLISLKEYLEIEPQYQSKIDDLKILFFSLYVRGKIDLIQSENPDHFLIKFNDDLRMRKISEKDLSIRNLEQNEKILEKNIEVLEDNVANCIKEAKNHLKKGHRNLAKSSLRKKHEIEQSIEKKMRALYNVQVLLQKLHDSKMDEEVWNTYKKTLKVFEESHKEINEDLVEDTMLKVGEMLEIQGDIQNALSRPIGDDTEDLEKELEDLLNMGDDENNKSNKGSPQQAEEEKLNKDFGELNIKLPSVPSSPVNISNENWASSQVN